MRSRFDPKDWMLDEIEFEAPLPIETMAITEEMPITIPSMVRLERVWLAESAV
jgi:hypothetical protein